MVQFLVVKTGLTTGFQCSFCDRDATHLVADRASLPWDRVYEPCCIFCTEKNMAECVYPDGVVIRKLKVINEHQD